VWGCEDPFEESWVSALRMLEPTDDVLGVDRCRKGGDQGKDFRDERGCSSPVHRHGSSSRVLSDNADNGVRN